MQRVVVLCDLLAEQAVAAAVPAQPAGLGLLPTGVRAIVLQIIREGRGSGTVRSQKRRSAKNKKERGAGTGELTLIPSDQDSMDSD